MKNIQEGEDEKRKEDLVLESQQGAVALAHSDPSVNAKETSGEGEVDTPVNVVNHDGEPPFRIPPLTAIAGVLIRHWAEGKIEGNASEFQKGHL